MANAVTATPEDRAAQRLALLRLEFVAALQRAAALANEIGEDHLSRYLAITADIQHAKLPPPQAPGGPHGR